MTVNTSLHIDRARQAWPVLVAQAKNGGQPLTYGQVSAQIGVHWRAAAWFLGIIQEECKLNNWPKLQAFAVNKRTGLPGGGFNGVRSHKAHAAEIWNVRNHNWPVTAPF